MKKIYSLTAGILLTATSMLQAQTSPRVVLFEEFTGENCPPCANINPYVKRFKELNSTDSFIHIAYQVPIPSAGPIYNAYKTDADARTTFYGVNFAPWGVCDGHNYPNTSSNVAATDSPNVYYFMDSASYGQTPATSNLTSVGFNARRALKSPCTIDIKHRYNATYDSCFVTAIVNNTSTYSATSTSKLKFRLAMVEKQLIYPTPPGTNGETEFEDVMRKMYPSAAGTTMLDTQKVSTADTFTFGMPIPKYVRNRAQLQFIGWVQDDNNKDIKQAGISQLAPATTLVDIIAYGDSVQGISCNNTGTQPIYSFVNVKNTGGATVTSLSVKVIVDGTLANTVPWTGSILPGDVASVNVGPLTVGSGQHSLRFVVGSPNGTSKFSVLYDTAKAITFLSGLSGPAPYVQAFETTTSFPPANCYSEAETQGTAPWYPSLVYGTTGITYWGAENTTHSIVFRGYIMPDGDISNFYLPKTNFTGITKASLTFWHAHRQYNLSTGLSNEQLEVQASTDCGTNWTTLWSKSGNDLASIPALTANANASYKPTKAADWVKDVVALGTFSNKNNVWIRFRGTSNNGDNVWVDQVNLDMATGIENIDNLDVFNLSPIPANEQVKLEIGVSKSSNFDITIVNTIGETVKVVSSGQFAQGINTLEVNTTDLATGIYNVVLKGTNQSLTKRFVIAH